MNEIDEKERLTWYEYILALFSMIIISYIFLKYILFKYCIDLTFISYIKHPIMIYIYTIIILLLYISPYIIIPFFNTLQIKLHNPIPNFYSWSFIIIYCFIISISFLVNYHNKGDIISNTNFIIVLIIIFFLNFINYLIINYAKYYTGLIILLILIILIGINFYINKNNTDKIFYNSIFNLLLSKNDCLK
jgi:hypothetical protein